MMFKTRPAEHLVATTPVESHLKICGALNEFEYSIIDKKSESSMLLTLEALHIDRLKPHTVGVTPALPDHQSITVSSVDVRFPHHVRFSTMVLFRIPRCFLFDF